ncbi:MAG: magnesium transporter CorA family protein [Patescibacteria group bacterium]|nr:magnesium transporter CorA family protein [Patescibacteria group bacterium]MDD5715748.1 magnesium transporter CorA family protein [Patescibacteria group bacterium]
MAVKTAQIFRLEWIHISGIREEDLDYLEQRFRFHQLDIRDCREGVQRPKLDIYASYLFMIFHFPLFNQETRRVSATTLNVFVGKNFLITLTSEPDEILDSYFTHFRSKKRSAVTYDSMKNSASYLLYKILDLRYRKSLPIVNEIGHYIPDVEEEVFTHRNKEATADLAIIRRNILTLRRILEPQIRMVDKIVHIKSSLISDKLSVYFDDVHDYLENIWSALESYRDTVDGLYDTNESLINQKTNEVIKTLTVISVALLPMTLVASIYGMNVKGLPFAEHPIGWVLVFIFLAATIILIITVSRKRNKI